MLHNSNSEKMRVGQFGKKIRTEAWFGLLSMPPLEFFRYTMGLASVSLTYSWLQKLDRFW